MRNVLLLLGLPIQVIEDLHTSIERPRPPDHALILLTPGFKKECPEGILTKEEFQNVYRTHFPHGDPNPFADYVFRVFDTDRSGTIEFKEFICALSVTSRGRMEDKLEWAFQLYDIDGDGLISYEEMLRIVEAIYKMVSAPISSHM